jgi:hypothetical protein
VAKKGWGGLGVRVTRATDAAHPARSLWLAQIQARGKLLEGSRRGTRPVRWLGSGAARGRGPRCKRAAGAEQVSEAEAV